MSLLELGLSTRSPSKGARVLCTKFNFLSGSGLDLVGLELEFGWAGTGTGDQIQFLRQPKCVKRDAIVLRSHFVQRTRCHFVQRTRCHCFAETFTPYQQRTVWVTQYHMKTCMQVNMREKKMSETQVFMTCSEKSNASESKINLQKLRRSNASESKINLQ